MEFRQTQVIDDTFCYYDKVKVCTTNGKTKVI